MPELPILRSQVLRVSAIRLCRNIGNVYRVADTLYGEVWYAGQKLPVHKPLKDRYWVPCERVPLTSKQIHIVTKDTN